MPLVRTVGGDQNSNFKGYESAGYDDGCKSLHGNVREVGLRATGFNLDGRDTFVCEIHGERVLEWRALRDERGTDTNAEGVPLGEEGGWVDELRKLVDRPNV